MLLSFFEQGQLENYADLQDLLMLAANKVLFEEKLTKVVNFYDQDFDKDRLKYQLETFSTMFENRLRFLLLSLLHFKKVGRSCESGIFCNVAQNSLRLII